MQVFAPKCSAKTTVYTHQRNLHKLYCIISIIDGCILIAVLSYLIYLILKLLKLVRLLSGARGSIPRILGADSRRRPKYGIGKGKERDRRRKAKEGECFKSLNY